MIHTKQQKKTVATRHVSWAQHIPKMCLWPGLCHAPTGGDLLAGGASRLEGGKRRKDTEGKERRMVWYGTV